MAGTAQDTPVPTDPHTLVLLVNLGSPAAPTPLAIRGFLRHFLGDRRVIDVPRAIWLPILYCFILPFRPRRLAHEYQSIWKGTMSPLHYHTGRLRGQVERSCRSWLATAPGGERDRGRFLVAAAMRYGREDSVPAVLSAMHEQHPSIKKLVVLPMFPQYTSTCSAAVFDVVFRFYLNPWRRRVPELHLLRDYADEPLYIAAVGDTLLAALRKYAGSTADEDLSAVAAQLGRDGDGFALVLSYHSIPYRYHTEGDNYAERCVCTTAALTAYLSTHLSRDVSSQVVQVFQSHFGSERWLEPFFDDTVVALPLSAEDGAAQKQTLAENLGRPEFATRQVRKCIVATPGFAVDCLETEHEVGKKGAEIFREHGGEYFAYVPCLNDSPAHAKALASIIEKYL